MSASVVEGIHAAIVAERGRAPIKASKGRARPVFTTGAGGAVTGLVQHADLLRGLLEQQALADVVVEGKRPERILCADCKAMVKVCDIGGVPKFCWACARKRVNDTQRARTRSERAANPEKVREKCRKYRTSQTRKKAARLAAAASEPS